MLKLGHLLLAGCALLAVTPIVAGSPAFAGGDNRYEVWDRHLFWNINRFEDGTCYATAAYQYGQFIRIGINGPDDYYIMLASPGVDQLKPVDGFQVRAHFDNGRRFNGTAGVNLTEGGTKIMEFEVSGEMLSSFMVANNMTIYTTTTAEPSKLVATMNLRGTYQAMLMAAACTGQHYRPQQRQQRNPFQNASW